MSEYKCPELGCDFHIGIGGQVLTDEDFEQQGYYFADIEAHERMHSEEVFERVLVRDLTGRHIGGVLESLGSKFQIQEVRHSIRASSVHIDLFRRTSQGYESSVFEMLPGQVVFIYPYEPDRSVLERGIDLV